MKIAHLVVMMVDSTSETWCGLDIDASGRHEVIYRSEIHAVLAEISRMCHLGPGRPLGHMAANLMGNGVVGQGGGQFECCKARRSASGTH